MFLLLKFFNYKITKKKFITQHFFIEYFQKFYLHVFIFIKKLDNKDINNYT